MRTVLGKGSNLVAYGIVISSVGDGIDRCRGFIGVFGVEHLTVSCIACAAEINGDFSVGQERNILSRDCGFCRGSIAQINGGRNRDGVGTAVIVVVDICCAIWVCG